MIKVNMSLCMYAWTCAELCNNIYDATNWDELNFPSHPNPHAQNGEKYDSLLTNLINDLQVIIFKFLSRYLCSYDRGF